MTAIIKLEAMVRAAEGLRLKAYICPAGKLTVGYGHTGKDVYPSLVIDNARAEALLLADCNAAIYTVAHSVLVPINDNQIAALADFVFNMGAGQFMGSTLLKLLNAKDYAGAANELSRWNHAHVDGVLVEEPGLTARRKLERDMFLAAA